MQIAIPKIKMALTKYRYLLYLCTALTGAVSLVYQIVWQRYLSILVGSEARSISLVVAVFLLGLACGYQGFGKLSKRNWGRHQLLRIYGYIELATAAYALLFPHFFKLLQVMSYSISSHAFFVDIAISILALFLPTFLMGASIPLLTMVIPEKAAEVNHCHAKVYGYNTLGAFLGILLTAFYLLPTYGLSLSLYTSGLLNLFVALVFIFNLLPKDEICNEKEDVFSTIPNPLPAYFYYIFVFVTGAVIIASEVIFVRVLNLTIGATVYNFPIILSVYILALALGSLSIKNPKIKVNTLTKNLSLALLFFLLAYLSAPYWSVWMSNMRVSLRPIPTNYSIFLLLSVLYLFVFLFPPCFFMGRLLPLAYALIPKNQSNYGKVCGSLYFFNTLGTVFGSIFLAHLCLYFANLDHILKYSLLSLLLLSVLLFVYEKKKVLSLVSLACFILTLLFIPLWDRNGHYAGYFRMAAPNKKHHFQEDIFALKKRMSKGNKIKFFDDGPNTTVTIPHFPLDTDAPPLVKRIFGKHSYSIFVNGKSDGNTIGDFIPTYLLAALPYFYTTKERALNAAVIGLGTGTTAGILARGRELKQVSILEISPKVIQGIKQQKSYPLNPLFMKKAKIVQTDAFKFFTRSQQKYDIIVAEPSNPWVAGVENLYTIEFYKMVFDSLSRQGIFSQWMHIYSANAEMIYMVFDAMRQSFPYLKTYLVGTGDIAILAAKNPITLSSVSSRRFYEMQDINFAIGLRQLQDLSLLGFLDDEYIHYLAKKNKYPHSLEAPKLSYLAHEAFFLGERYSVAKGVNVEERLIRRTLLYDKQRLSTFQSYADVYRSYNTGDRIKIRQRCIIKRLAPFCHRLDALLQKNASLLNPSIPLKTRLESYALLRDQGLIPLSLPFLELVRREILKSKPKADVLLKYFFNLTAEQLYRRILPDLKVMAKDKRTHHALVKYLNRLTEARKKLPKRSATKSIRDILDGIKK